MYYPATNSIAKWEYVVSNKFIIWKYFILLNTYSKLSFKSYLVSQYEWQLYISNFWLILLLF